MKPLLHKRILVCGKGGSGKSSVVTLLANVLQDRDYGVILIDGDASNPGGLARLSMGAKNLPRPLIEFFGGRNRVECPVDDPSPLKRLTDSSPIVEKHIALEEIPSQYYIRKGNIVLFQVGKIQMACEGCDGPMSKVTRDFIVDGDYITLIDVEAGIEHFGRGVERNVDIVLIIVDPSFESFQIAERVTKLCHSMKIEHVLAILNNVRSEEMESFMRSAMTKRAVSICGSIFASPKLQQAGLTGDAIGKCQAIKDIPIILDMLETLLTENELLQNCVY